MIGLKYAVMIERIGKDSIYYEYSIEIFGGFKIAFAKFFISIGRKDGKSWQQKTLNLEN